MLEIQWYPYFAPAHGMSIGFAVVWFDGAVSVGQHFWVEWEQLARRKRDGKPFSIFDLIGHAIQEADIARRIAAASRLGLYFNPLPDPFAGTH